MRDPQLKFVMSFFSWIAVTVVLYIISAYFISNNYETLFSTIAIPISAFFMGIVIYVYSKEKLDGGQYPGPWWLEKYNPSNLVSFANNELSEKYSGLLSGIVENGLEVRIFANNGKFPPAFVGFGEKLGKTPTLYIEDSFIDELSESELTLLILHELAHVETGFVSKNFLMQRVFVFSFLVALALLMTFINLKILFILYPVPLFLFLISALSLILMIRLNKQSQIEADAFAIKHCDEKKAMISLLGKLEDYLMEGKYSDSVRTRSLEELKKRMEKIRNI